MTAQIIHGNNLDVLPTIADCSVDSIVTDPPYELGFMGKKWDASGIAYNVELWRECLRVLKPGGHLLAFGGTRTYHRMAVAIEDAGFEIRDSIHWLYGSGFPKSMDVSKAIDKMDASEEQEKRRLRFTAWVRSTGLTAKQIDHATGTNMGGHYTTAASQPAIMTREHLEAVRHLINNVPEWVERECDIRSVESRNFAEREVVGTINKGSSPLPNNHDGRWNDGQQDGIFDITAPATDAARQWDGWGTALKPAHEPIVLARKPLAGTVAHNVLTYGTGSLNINGTRIGQNGGGTNCTNRDEDGACLGHPEANGSLGGGVMRHTKQSEVGGRWPANVILDDTIDDDWARYFYCAKPSRAERNAGLDRNHHPTVKPIALMRYLIRLVTPPDGTVLEPFAGSGTTLAAATLENMNSIGIELTDDYLPIIQARIKWAEEQTKEEPPSLF